MAAPLPSQKKLCFVTIGATAAFPSLLKVALSHEFLRALQDAGYTEVVVQYGKGGKTLFDKEMEDPLKMDYGMSIKGFDFNSKGLETMMVEARSGCVISHAGTGTILTALRLSVPIIVVANPKLLDNHQEELADTLSKQGYVVHGKLGFLPSTLQAVEIMREKHESWPPVNSGTHRSGSGLKGVLDEEAGFLD